MQEASCVVLSSFVVLSQLLASFLKLPLPLEHVELEQMTGPLAYHQQGSKTSVPCAISRAQLAVSGDLLVSVFCVIVFFLIFLPAAFIGMRLPDNLTVIALDTDVWSFPGGLQNEAVHHCKLEEQSNKGPFGDLQRR